MNKVVVLLSGGLDSSVLLYKLESEEFDCFPLTISYGQRHSKEVMSARNISESCGLIERWKYLNLDTLGNLLPSSLTGIGEIPEGHYADESMKSTVVPNRNMIFLSIAAGYAQGLGASFVAYAAHKGDHPIYPDCRPEFIEACNQTIKLGTGWSNDGVSLITPFSSLTKAEIVKLGDKLEIPFERTWSCYKGGDKHCGACGTCRERAEAFSLAGIKDPTVYKES